jgi:enoyl-CoA hydratase/carnithine racemase
MIAISDTVRIRKDAPSGTIILNRPDRCNALSREVVGLIHEALEDFLLESSVRAIILTGSGSSFCSGADLHEIKETFAEPDAMQTWQSDAQQFLELIQYMLEYPKPIVCGVNGWVVGSGCALMLASDIVIAGENAHVLMPEAQRGLSPGFTAPLLSFRIGVGQTAKILLSGLPHSADEAANLGLFHEVTGDDFVWARCQELAIQCASGARESHQMTKKLLNGTIGEHLLTQLAIGAANTAAARTTAAAGEGITAFLEKREPDWNSLRVIE